MADNVVPLRGGDDSERLAEQAVAEVARRLARARQIEETLFEFVAHVRRHRAAGWFKTPMHDCCDHAGFERLAALVEREGS